MAVLSTAQSPASATDGNWSEICEEIAERIMDFLGEEIANLFYFGAVCSWWRSVMQNYIRKHRPKNQIPWRLLGENSDRVRVSVFRFRSFTNKRQYNVDVPPHLHGLIVGCSKGFIGLLPTFRKPLHIYNPITGAHFTFPEILSPNMPLLMFTINTDDNNCNKCSHAAYLSVSDFSSPRAESLTIAKVGDTRWTYIFENDLGAYCIDDIMFHKNRLYVVTNKAERTLVFDLSSGGYLVNFNQLHPMVDLTLSRKAGRVSWIKFVESSDQNDLFLLVVYQIADRTGFPHEVFKFDGCRHKWDAVGTVYAELSFYDRAGILFYQPLCRWETVFLGLQIQFYENTSENFIQINARNETAIELKIYMCNGHKNNRWFLPML